MDPGDSLGRYRLVGRISHGAMGEVWEAESLDSLSANVAIKIIPEFLSHDAALVARLRREAEAIGRLDHPGVVRLLKVGEDGGRVYLAMELLRGETLGERLARESPLPLAALARLAGELADALAYVHAQGIVHRDLKPANIFLAQSGETRLIDLGVAKVLDETALTVTGSHFGTPAYMSPEAFRDAKRVGPAADVWSLGVILYQAATGQMPFAGSSAATIIARVSDTNVTPQAPGRLRSDLPASIAEAIARCLERDPERRPSAGELTRIFTGRAKRYLPAAQRRRILAGVAGVVVLALSAVGGAAWFGRKGEAPTPAPASAPSPAAVPAPIVFLPVEIGPAEKFHPVPIGFTVTDSDGVRGENGFEGPRRIRHSATGYELVLVPTGAFTMGAEDGESDEAPSRRVRLDPFWIGATEVTQAQFSAFVTSTRYRTEAEKGRPGRPGRRERGGRVGTANRWSAVAEANWRHPYGPDAADPYGESHPVVQVSWDDARAFTAWAGLRLPTEAEWEKAARGVDDPPRAYPWGDRDDEGWRNGRGSADGFEKTAPVGSFPDGASPYGCLDMAGNVFEWVGDWYGKNYYRDGPAQNPTGPDTGPYRVIRGGAWHGGSGAVRATNRPPRVAEPIASDIGFRAAVSPAE